MQLVERGTVASLKWLFPAPIVQVKLVGSGNNACLTEGSGHCYCSILKKVNLQHLPLRKVKVPAVRNHLMWEMEVLQKL